MARRLTSVLSQKTLILGGIALFAIFAAWVKAGVEITRPLIELTKDGEVISQHTSEVEAMERASEASGTYKLVRPDATIVVTDDCEVCPPVDPVDPNEPEDPNEPVEPPDPNEPVAFEPHDPYGLGWPAEKYPELWVTYQPQLPSPGAYSVDGVCEDVHTDIAKTVTLKDRERLQDALARLKAKNIGGGVIEIPWNVDTVQCDRLANTGGKSVYHLTLRGILGPNGERPRFYCRAARLGGTVEAGFGGTFLTLGEKDLATPPKYMMENLHIDGYGTWVMNAKAGQTVVRNNYMHHGTNDGNTVNEIHWGSDDRMGVEIQYCGNEFSHGGQDNAQHTFYMHRGKPGKEIEMVLVDNICHSSNWSSCYKSTAAYNWLTGNRFYKTIPHKDYPPHDEKYSLGTDPLYDRKYSQMQVDISACGTNLVENNYFYAWRPEPKGYASNWMVAFRNRKGIYGCDRPRGWWGTNTEANKLPDSEFWTAEYWTEPDEYVATVRNNIFESLGKNAKATAIASWGTYPTYASKQFGNACLLESPEWWVERHKVVAYDNTFIGFGPDDDGTKYKGIVPGHDESACGYPMPETASKRTTDYFEVH